MTFANEAKRKESALLHDWYKGYIFEFAEKP